MPYLNDILFLFLIYFKNQNYSSYSPHNLFPMLDKYKSDCQNETAFKKITAEVSPNYFVFSVLINVCTCSRCPSSRTI